jgi:integrase
MASITKREKSKFWIACYTDRDGRQLKRSTKTTDRRTALQIALELERVERQAMSGAITTVQLRKVLNDVSEKINGDTLIAPSTEDYLNDWLKTLAVRNKAGTIERYDNTVRLFLESLGERAKRPVSGVMPKDVEAFVTERMKAGMAPQTVNIDLKTLNTAFRRAENYSIILKNPVAAVRPPKVVRSEREVFTHEEVQKLANAAPSLDWQTLILLGYFTGARLSDCVHMKWENVDAEKRLIVYEQQKTGKKVPVPMHYQVMKHLKYLTTFGTNGFLCPKLASKGPGGKHGLSESFKRIVVKAGLDLMVVKGKGVRNFTKRTFHSLRHSFNSALANAGVAEEVRMKLTGHSTKAMNQNYTHLQLGTLQEAVKTLPTFGRASS